MRQSWSLPQALGLSEALAYSIRSMSYVMDSCSCIVFIVYFTASCLGSVYICLVLLSDPDGEWRWKLPPLSFQVRSYVELFAASLNPTLSHGRHGLGIFAAACGRWAHVYALQPGRRPAISSNRALGGAPPRSLVCQHYNTEPLCSRDATL